MDSIIKTNSKMADISFDEVYTMADIFYGKSQKYGRGWAAKLIKAKREEIAQGNFGEHPDYESARREIWIMTLAIQFGKHAI